jgi:hypothetical protein
MACSCGGVYRYYVFGVIAFLMKKDKEILFMNKYAEQALREYNNEDTAAHLGGVDNRPFWNGYSTQFTFVPAFHFPKILRAKNYLFTAEDKNGIKHSFTAARPTASLAPIWADIPVGIVHLKVESLNEQGEVEHIAGARSFYKSMPFPGREAYPPKARTYRECALMAYRYIYNDEAVQHWLTYGKPMADYAHNVYPAKTIDGVIRAMVGYAKLEPTCAENALKLACRAADYLLSISFDGEHPLAGLPPTYSFKDLNAEAVNKVAPAAQKYASTTMMIYPIYAGIAYLTLSEATGDKKYFNAAIRIAEYYKKTVLPSGSWHLLRDCESGKPLSDNLCVNFGIVKFFHELYKKTQDEAWHQLEVGHYKYITDKCLKDYKWEGQFEDTAVSLPYENLTHFHANNLIDYIVKNLSDDKEMRAEAIELIRFVEDQFVVWGEHPAWNYTFGPAPRYYPAGLEQYDCYAPIDGSTATIMIAFANMYTLTKERLYLEKAMALADMITRVQNSKTGQIPTFWMGENCSYGYKNFWLNCMLGTADAMMNFAELTELLE